MYPKASCFYTSIVLFIKSNGSYTFKSDITILPMWRQLDFVSDSMQEDCPSQCEALVL